MTQLKEPNDAHKMAGYMLRKAAAKFDQYANKAVSCSINAIVEEQEKGEEIYYYEIAEEIALIREAQAYVNRIIEGKVHRRLAKKAEKKGYRPLTIEDHRLYGATGSGR